MSNQWLAIDVATAPAKRAREVRRAWERFVGGGWERIANRGDTVSLREPIAASWRRSAAAGVDPSGARIAPIVADAEETSARWEIHPLAEMASLIRECLAASADESGHLIVVADANGVLLWVEGNPQVRMRAADSMNFAEGTLWSEGGAGTNAIGTALAAQHAVQVFATEHFNEGVQSWTCAAAPVHDPDSGQVIGVIDLTGEMSTVHPHSMAVATATAQAVEAQLRCQMLDRDGKLLSRYGDQLTAGPGPSALVAPSGRVIASRPLGWLLEPRLKLPTAGAELTLASNTFGPVEALGHDDAFLVRAAPGPAARRRSAPALKLSCWDASAPARAWAASRCPCGCATPKSSPCCAPTPRGSPARS
jgi:transcriptional regulator of acetoin/glycerol metabolism